MEMSADQSERQSEEQCPSSVITVTTSPPTLGLFPSQSLAERKLKDVCFRCGKRGHWAQDCLSNGPTAKASSPSSPPLDTHLLPVLRCRCGVACTVCVSRSESNYGRRYYSLKCNYDNVTQGRNFYKWCDDVKAPMCNCGAGACTINIQKGDNGKDTKYFTCRIRGGHGSCGFFQFDSPPNPPNSWPRSTKIDKRPSTLNLQHGDLLNIKTHEDECSIPSFSNRNIVVHELETCDLVTGKGHRASHLTSRSDIHSRQKELNSPNGYDEVDEVPQNALGNDTQPLGDPLGTSSLKTSFTAMEKGVTNTILKKVGKNHQKDHLTHLELMEPPDHSTMLQVVNDTFDASISPSIDCGPFVERLVESSQGISIVAGMESTLQDNCNQAVPKNIEKCLFDISGINAEAFATVTDTGSHHLQSVHEAASCIKDVLCQIEKLETDLLKTAKDVGQSKRCIQATYQELTKSLKLPQENEEQMHCNKDNIK